MKKLAFIGAGKMAEAILKGALDAKVLNAAEVVAGDIDTDRLNRIKNIYSIDVSTDNAAVAQAVGTILLAVKPQHIDDALESLGPLNLSDKLVISIAAGVTTKHILAVLKRPARLVRVMPNAPALVGRGMSALTFPPDLPDEDRDFAIALFKAVGEIVILEESFMDQATAISGSGPAYFFYIVKALTQAGEIMGFSPEIAAKLVISTISGSAHMLEKGGLDAETLIGMVASKGGTTEAALQTFDRGNISDIMIQGVLAALKRAGELNSSAY